MSERCSLDNCSSVDQDRIELVPSFTQHLNKLYNDFSPLHFHAYRKGTVLEQAQQTVMATNQPEDFIAKQGTDGLRLWIDLTNIINDQGVKIATLKHAVQQLKQLLQKPDTSKAGSNQNNKRVLRDIYLVSASPHGYTRAGLLW